MSKPSQFELPTLAMLLLTYLVWGLATVWVAGWSTGLAMVLVVLSAAQHSSLQHEALHGHPTRLRFINELLVFPSLSLCIPYGRFRDSHLEHHHDERLTDPYDDPESNYLDPKVWNGLPGWWKAVLRVNNTLAGRILLGPAVSQIAFMRGDWKAWKNGKQGILSAWLWHIPSVALVIWWMASFSPMPVWAWLVATYFALSVLKIRTYLEHRAHDDAQGRTVVIEDRGPLSLIFLNNNLHVVHHTHPGVPWYELPVMFREHRDRYLGSNDGYYFRNYGQIFAKFLFKAKDPVPHPLWPK